MIANALLLCLSVIATLYVDGNANFALTDNPAALPLPPPCKSGNFDQRQSFCVHPKQCTLAKGISKPNAGCTSTSPTGRRLTCCANYEPTRRPVDADRVCGVRPSLTPRSERMETEAIVGGVESVRFSWPWMAAIYKNKNFLCGGALISDKCVLTAAHCFEGKENEAENYYVRLGEHNLFTDTKDEYPEDIQAYKIHVHPKFAVNCSDDDIAIIQLMTPSLLTPICLPGEKDKNIVGNKAVVAGWGTTIYDSQFREPFSSYLQEVSIPIKHTTDSCDKHYKSIPEYKQVFKKGIEDSRFICAGVEDGSRDACLGDSGGPLMMEVTSSVWHQVGVVCIGYGCGMKGYPGVYTRVSEYTPWIKKYCSFD